MDIKNFIQTDKAYFENFITRATHHSNSIEGNTLSMAETYAIIFNEPNIKVTASPREFYEAVNHKYAMNYILNQMGETLIEKDILNIAIWLNKNIDEISGYRKSSVFIRGAEHIPPAPNMVKQQMMFFVHNYNNTAYDTVFDKVAATHIEFERIHPFADGNGRTGRLLICYELLKNNIAPAIVTKDNKAEYLNCIERQDTKGLSRLLNTLSNKEHERIKIFAAGQENPNITYQHKHR